MNIPVYVLDLSWSIRDKLRGITEIARLVWHIRPHVVHMVNYHSNLLVRLARPLLPSSSRLLGSVRVEYTGKQLLYENLSGWLCSEIVCNSPHLQRKVRGALLISNGVDSQRFSANPDPELRSRVAPHAECVFLMLGRISRQKAPHLLVEAIGGIEMLPQNVTVLVVGECDDRVEWERFQASIERYNLRDVVNQFPATVAPEAFYHAADVTVLPSLWEGCPNVILESLAAGRPVIVSEAANAAGLVQHGVNGWVHPTGDVRLLAATLEVVAELSTSELRAMGSACRATAAAFPIWKMVQAYEELYGRLIAR
jgi:glycosyltransferase involved in cell wall biosynthesis